MIGLIEHPHGMNTNDDRVYPFHLPDAGVRGQVAYLDSSWQQILAHADYPAGVRQLLGESLAASAMFAGALKFDGSLSIHLRSAGALRLLFAECTHAGELRGIARCNEGSVDAEVDLTQPGSQLAITIENAQTETQRVADTGGMSGSVDSDAWNRVSHLLATLGEEELLDLPVETLLLRLFHEEGVILQAGRPLRFNCSCSRERVLGMLRALGRDEAFAGIDETGKLRVTCEFCNRDYVLDEVDLAGQFAKVPAVPGPPTAQ